MGDFIKHTSCERCGSSDARSLYLGGSSFCFSCRHYSSSRISPYVSDEKHKQDRQVDQDLSLPDDAGTDYSPLCLQWINKYGLSTTELLENGVLWSEKKKQLIFTFKDDEGKLLLWQARNFWNGAKTKYFTKGNPETLLPIYASPRSSGNLALVEDCVSAIKISRYCDAMPVLGSDLSRDKLKRLRAYYGPSWAVVVWLDGNMYPKAQRMSRRLAMLGMDSRCVWTKLDPKEYSDEEIREVLTGA